MTETFKFLMDRYGLPTVVALGAGFVLRQDVLLPLVQQHSAFLQTVSESQREISKAVQEQTKLLYALKPELKEQFRTVDVRAPDEGAN